MLNLLEELENCWEMRKRAVLATIFDKIGSTYRGIGAQSLILEDGHIIGTLSGGCVESDIYEHALEVMSSGMPKALTYDFRGSDDSLWGLGVGCNGSLSVWLSPFDPVRHPIESEKMLQIMRLRLSSRGSFSIVTVIESSDADVLAPGSQFVFGHSSEETEDFIRSFREIAECAKQYLSLNRSGLVSGEYLATNGNKIKTRCLIQSVNRVPRLVVFGAGPDVVPLVWGAKLLQWHVTVVDHRPGFASKEKFPEADEIIVSAQGTFPPLDLDEETNVVVMTHHYEQDRMFLAELLTRKLAYLGILGPRSRTEKLLKDIEKIRKIDDSDSFSIKNLFSPVGLDIGAETPEEIAISILSEIICNRNNRSGMSLKLRKSRIHEYNEAPQVLFIGGSV